jgi:hypothetical protein
VLFYFVLVENRENRCDINGGRTRTRTLDPLIKSPSRAVVLEELFSQRVAKWRLKGQYLAAYFPNGTAPAQVQRTYVSDNLRVSSMGVNAEDAMIDGT